MDASSNLTKGLSEPPEGAITGDSVPRENEEYDVREQKVRKLARRLKAEGKPFSEMKESERMEYARRFYRRYMEDS